MSPFAAPSIGLIGILPGGVAFRLLPWWQKHAGKLVFRVKYECRDKDGRA